MKKEQSTNEVDKFLLKQCNKIWAFFKKLPKTWYDEDERLHLLEFSQGPGILDDPWCDGMPCDSIVTISIRRAGIDNDTLEYFQHPADCATDECVKEFYETIHKYTPFPPNLRFYDAVEEVSKVFDAYVKAGID